MSRAETLAERVANNTIMTAVARVAMIAASLIGVPLGSWVIVSVKDLQTQAALTTARFNEVDAIRVASRIEFLQRLEVLERQNREDAAARLVQVERTAEAVATMRAMQTTLERIERRLDYSARPAP